MSERKNGNKLDLLSIIKQCLPNALAEWQENLDFGWSGYLVCPKPGLTLMVSTPFNEGRLCVQIVKYEVINFGGNEKLSTTVLYRGPMPRNEHLNPDYQFIGHFLKNCDTIG